MTELVRRVDVGTRIRADMRTPGGMAKIPATLTRTGVFVYRNLDGSPRRELRPAEEVFRKDSLATLETSVVTVGHVADVSAASWKNVAVGDVRNARPEGIFVAADVVVRDAAALKRIDSDGADRLVELSMGYRCRYDATPGTLDGEAYDGVQRDIVYDHVALLPANTGRAGADVRLRLDGVADDELGMPVDERSDAAPRPADMGDETKDKKASDLQARLDAITVDFESARKRVTELEASVATETKRADKAEGERDALKTRADSLEQQTSRLDALVDERFTLIENASVIVGKRIDSKGSAREIMIAAIVSTDKEFRADGKTDDYVAGRFDTVLEQAKKAGKSLATINTLTAAPRVDALDSPFAKLIVESAQSDGNRFGASYKKES